MQNGSLSLSPAELRKLRRGLLAWYDQHRRELPWRSNRDPYRVWVSEIMLQQTRVAAVLDHYARWMKRFPTVESLAAAKESSVLAVWSGLGYYHRARRMHQAAKVVVREREGKLPDTAEEWRALPGIGRYTAAAIASIACGEAVAVVDGNVERVLGRMFGPADRAVAWPRAELLLSRERPGDFNQGMMELGATVCTPRAPQCLICPVLTWCKSRGAAARTPQAERKRKQLCYALSRRDGAVLLVQRAADASLMAGMWELPLLRDGARDGHKVLGNFRHSITDTDYAVSVVDASEHQGPFFDSTGQWFNRKRWQQMPLTGLTRKVLRKLLPESNRPEAESKTN
jgi:A/G-specific adenine glycosylase